MSGAFVVLPGQGEQLDLGNFHVEVLASGAGTDDQYSLLRTYDEPHGFGPPMHRHRDSAEAFFVLAGEYLMFLEDQQRLCPPGSFVYVPRDLPHTFQVASEEPGTKLNLFTPASRVEFFRELAAAEADGLATPELLDEIAERSNMEVLGPVPESYL